jgi:hypothetical protein
VRHPFHPTPPRPPLPPRRLSPLERLLLFRALRPDALPPALAAWVEAELRGQEGGGAVGQERRGALTAPLPPLELGWALAEATAAGGEGRGRTVQGT